ncbi:UDP-4-amino-4,6-dideoxy-N-acetyl-beta-L-altrosamine N-acetyltransferase [Mesorhizobium newzealandense]|uniref:UDP-4-amino-4, 6-dideoxy-N-acetyl-beta-L-altrosamine N-acetyltransferase n=1 Tax=Mesorhizobium newzealandense TaxID=1300302 RepID=A0ABW4UAB4_9HYPH
MSSLGKLRAIEDDELELMRSWRNAPAVRANMYTRHEISQAEHLSWWKQTSGCDDQKYFMYECNGIGHGIVGITSIDFLNANCSWAFYASTDAPKGVGSRMEYLALEYVFGQMGLHKLYCEVLAFNEAVIKLHQKFGFRVEGVFHQHHSIDGKYVDIYRLGLLAPEWSSIRNNLYAKLSETQTGR